MKKKDLIKQLLQGYSIGILSMALLCNNPTIGPKIIGSFKNLKEKIKHLERSLKRRTKLSKSNISRIVLLVHFSRVYGNRLTNVRNIEIEGRTIKFDLYSKDDESGKGYKVREIIKF